MYPNNSLPPFPLHSHSPLKSSTVKPLHSLHDKTKTDRSLCKTKFVREGPLKRSSLSCKRFFSLVLNMHIHRCRRRYTTIFTDTSVVYTYLRRLPTTLHARNDDAMRYVLSWISRVWRIGWHGCSRRLDSACAQSGARPINLSSIVLGVANAGAGRPHPRPSCLPPVSR